MGLFVPSADPETRIFSPFPIHGSVRACTSALVRAPPVATDIDIVPGKVEASRSSEEKVKAISGVWQATRQAQNDIMKVDWY